MSFGVRRFVSGIPISHVTPIITGTKNSLPPGMSPEQHEAARKELNEMLNKLIGKVDHPNNYAKKLIDSDRLVAILHKSTEDRFRMIDQYLRCRHGNPRESFRMISNALEWRSTLDLESYVIESRSILAHPGARFPMTVCSSSKHCEQPVIYGLMRLLDKRKVERTPFSHAVIAFFETLFFKENYETEEMIVILDFRGWSLRKHAPFRSVKEGLQTLQNYYPDRLGRCFLVNYPASLKAAYTAISPIIDSGARSKIVWVADDPNRVMNEHRVESNSIPTFMGGTLEAYIPDYWPDVRNEWENPDLVAQHAW